MKFIVLRRNSIGTIAGLTPMIQFLLLPTLITNIFLPTLNIIEL